jgi:hypothetical protein
MACESDKCEKYGLHHDYENGVEIRKCHMCEKEMLMEWISVKDKLPPVSFVESDVESDPYEPYPVLFFIPGHSDGEIVVGWYEEENLSPFPNIPRFVLWNGHNMDDSTEVGEPTHWMPLPEPPKRDS